MLEVPVLMTCGQLVQSISRCDVHGRVAERDVGVTDVGCVNGEPDHPMRHRGIEYAAIARSEEHTSELQSRRDLVCRLLLEKKNEQYGNHHGISLVDRLP